MSILRSNPSAHLTDNLQIVKDASKLVITGLGRKEIIEASDSIKWRDSATIVRGDAVARMADEEGEMELA